MKKIWYNYEDIHRAIKQLAEKIQASEHSFDAMIRSEEHTSELQ